MVWQPRLSKIIQRDKRGIPLRLQVAQPIDVLVATPFSAILLVEEAALGATLTR